MEQLVDQQEMDALPQRRTYRAKVVSQLFEWRERPYAPPPLLGLQQIALRPWPQGLNVQPSLFNTSIALLQCGCAGLPSPPDLLPKARLLAISTQRTEEAGYDVN